MRKNRTLLQTNIINIRTTLRKRMEVLARSHRGCTQARNCGCFTDQTIAILEATERKLFDLEIKTYSTPQNEHGGYDHYKQKGGDVTSYQQPFFGLPENKPEDASGEQHAKIGATDEMS
jgi:hypothetical protein